MTAANPSDPNHVPPPRILPRDPRPMVETLRTWPFVLIGASTIALLAGVTILPDLLADGPEPVRVDSAPARMTDPRGLRGMPSDYSQVERPPAPEPAPAPEPKPGPQQPVQPQRRVIVQGGGGQPDGLTRAELLKAARMADLAPVGVGNGSNGGGAVPAAMDGGAGGVPGGGRPAGKLYNPHGLTSAMPCQVDAGTNIPAMTEQRLTSESPGTVSAVVMRDIWSADKSCLAIPRGTRFVGRYQTAVAEGQARLGILWTGLTRPPPRGDSIELEDTVAGDPDGTAGVSGAVNGHFWRKLAYVTAASVLDLGKTAITAGGEGGIGAAVAGIFANRATSPVDEWARRQLDIAPVIEVAPRGISIVLAQHLPMDEFRTGR